MRPPRKPDPDFPDARPGVGRLTILVVPFGANDIVEPLLQQIADALDLLRIRRGWCPADYLTRDTLHVTTTPLDGLQGAGFGRHCVTLQNALLEVKRVTQ